MRRLFAMALFLAVPGCTCGARTVGIWGEGRFEPSPGVEVEGRVATLDFGIVRFGDRRSADVLLVNTGRGALFVSAANGLDDPFQLLEDPSGREIAARERMAIRFEFAPPRSEEELWTSRAYESELTLALGGTEHPAALTVRLRGEGARGEECLHLTPNPLELGAVRLGCFATREVAVQNDCEGPLQLEGAEFSAPGFTALSDGLPRELMPGESHALQVRFEPLEAGAHAAVMRVLFGPGENSTARRLEVTGSAVLPPRVTESFTPTRAVDVLLVHSHADETEHFPPFDGGYPVYDTGGIGLLDERDRGLSALLSGFLDGGVDFHLGFTRSCWDHYATTPKEFWPPDWTRGELTPPLAHPGPLVFTGATLDLFRLGAGANYNAAAPYNDCNGSYPGCFESARRALTEPIASGKNAGFARDGVPLAIVCFDGEGAGGDWSTTTRPVDTFNKYEEPLPVGFYVDALEKARGGPHRFALNAVSIFENPLPQDCDIVPPEKFPEKRSNSRPSRDRYIEAANATGGVTIDYCENWGEALLESEPWTAMHRKFRLQGTPDAREPIEVSAAGVRLAPTDWHFDPASRVIELSQLPPLGELVEVTYTPSCPQ